LNRPPRCSLASGIVAACRFSNATRYRHERRERFNGNLHHTVLYLQTGGVIVDGVGQRTHAPNANGFRRRFGISFKWIEAK
jgi:hypothetical protein